MRIHYLDWTAKEIETAEKLTDEGHSMAAVSRHLNRPYSQTTTIIHKIQHCKVRAAAGHLPRNNSVSQLRILAGKLRRLESNQAYVCENAAEYILELEKAVRTNTKAVKSVWDTTK